MESVKIVELFILVLLAVILGFILGRSSRSRSVLEFSKRSGRRAYLRGLNYVLSKEPDKAIAELTKAARINTDTVEIYQSLGNLFREKGEIDRAIKIHQNIVARENIDDNARIDAMTDLGIDYRKAGIFDQAIATFLNVIEQRPSRLDAHEHLEKIYEEEKEWEEAIEVQKKIQRLRRSKTRNVLAHLNTERGKCLAEKGQNSEAVKAFEEAIEMDPACVDAHLHLGDLYFEQGEREKAIQIWREIIASQPKFAFLTYKRLHNAYKAIGEGETMMAILEEAARKYPDDIQTLMALGRYCFKAGDHERAESLLKKVVDKNPRYLEAHQILGDIYFKGERKDEALASHRNLLQIFNPVGMLFHCGSCGYESREVYWKCPQCKEWDTFEY